MHVWHEMTLSTRFDAVSTSFSQYLITVRTASDVLATSWFAWSTSANVEVRDAGVVASRGGRAAPLALAAFRAARSSCARRSRSARSCAARIWAALFLDTTASLQPQSDRARERLGDDAGCPDRRGR